MGMFDNLTGGAAGGDWAKQAADAQKAADEILKNSGYAGGTADPAANDIAGLSADRGAIEAQAHEQNRILGVGSPASITIDSKVDTGESVAGNAKYILNLTVTPEGGTAYKVELPQIIPPSTLSGYADGTTMAGRIDPADKNLVAFGDKPFM